MTKTIMGTMTISNFENVTAVVNRKFFLLIFSRPFPSSPQSLFQSKSKWEIFVMVISSNFNMNEN